jgi:hypothetical protein
VDHRTRDKQIKAQPNKTGIGRVLTPRHLRKRSQMPANALARAEAIAKEDERKAISGLNKAVFVCK